MPKLATRRLARAAVETLETRRLLAFSGQSFDLPLRYDFTTQANGVEDAAGLNVGFPIVQGNDNNDELDSTLIDLDTAAGLLRVTSSGNATNGSNFGDDNSLVNGLQLPFDATSDWLVHTRVALAGDTLDGISEGFEQFGLMIGPSQDNYVKLVFAHDGSDNIVQFLVETTNTTSTATRFPLGEGGATSDVAAVTGVNLGSAEYIDLWLAGDASTGVISAQYRVEGGVSTRFTETYTAVEGLFRSQSRAGLIVAHKNDGDAITAEFDDFEVTREALPNTRPAVGEVRPGDDADNVFRDEFVAVDLVLPNASVSGDTLTPANVFLTRDSDGLRVPSEINTTGGGDAIVLTPDRALDADTDYTFTITGGVTDLFGVAFEPFESSFTTNFELSGQGGSLGGVAFEQIDLPAADGTIWSSVTIGPDGRLYATAIDGEIKRFDINADGTLATGESITSLTDAEGADRVVTGLVFAPDATASNLVAYVTHTQFNDVTTSNPSELGDDFTGKLSRLSGPSLGTVTDLVDGLPRSIRDHLTNQPVFGPDGRIYIGQGANNAMGAPDAAWGFREEQLLSGNVLAVDIDAIEAGGTAINVRTGSAGSYDPLADDAPVTIYGEGVRNAYNVLFHSNGSLYAPTNGSAAGGNTPAAPDGSAVGLNNVSQTQNDYLFRIEDGGYYGHPNPTLGNYVLGGGNPTSGADVAQVDAYPIGTLPEDNYGGFAYDFGKNQSPNGAIEFNADVFDNALNGKLIVTRFSGGDDLIVLDVNDNGTVTGGTTGIPGFDQLSDPLDLVQTAGGSLYVSEYGSQTITLLKPVATGGSAKEASKQIFIDAAAGEGELRPLVIRNTGTEPLIVNPYTLGITGADKDLFEYVNAPTTAVTVQPGGAASFDVRFNAPADANVGDTFTAVAFVRTSDENAPEVGATVTGFVRRGIDGANEPSLQDIFDLYDLGITTGDPDPDTTEIEQDELGGIDAQLFRPADPSKPIAIEVIGSYSPERTPALSFGTYEPGKPESLNVLGEVLTAQGLDPVTNAAPKFFVDGTFGLYLKSPAFNSDPIDDGISAGRGRVVYSEGVLNTWEPAANERDKTGVYRIDAIDDALAVSFEEFELASDYNDLVLVMRNVEPVADVNRRLAIQENGVDEGLDRLIFSEIDPANRDNTNGTQVVRNSRDFDLINASASPLVISSIDEPAGFSASVADTSLAAGESTTLTIDFDATSEGTRNGVYEGDIDINFVDGLRTFSVAVGGYYMPYSEDDVASGNRKSIEEPSLNEMMEVFGLTTDVGTEAQRLTGTADAIGDEVLSQYWRAAQQDLPVEVYQLAAFHNTNSSDPIYWFPEGGSTDEASAASNSTEIFRHNNTSSQSFLPEINGGTSPAAGSFSPGAATFGLRVVNEYSVDDFNDNNSPGVPDDQHLFRFFPVKNANGETVDDAWIVTMDFTGFNFDYNDNVYLVRNMQPAGQAAPPIGLNATQLNDGRGLVFFGQPTGTNGVGVFRSDDAGNTFTRVATFSEQGFYDVEDADDDTVIRVAGLDADGNAGTFSEVRLA